MARITTSTTSATQARPGPKASTPARTICIIILALLVLLALIILITWAALKPKKLIFSIDTASIHDYSLENSKLNSTFDFTIRAQNPNHRVSVYYNALQVYVEYDGQVVAKRVMGPFVQGHKNVTVLKAEMVARNFGLNGPGQKNLKRERTGGSVDLDVRVRGKIRFKAGKWKSGLYKLKVLCSPVVVFADPKRFQPVECEADL